MSQVVSRALPFLKTFAKGMRFAPGIRIGTGLWSGTSRLLSGEPLHKVGLGYAQALPGPIGWSAVATDLANQSGLFEGRTPKEFQVGGKYGPSEEALIDLADQETLFNNQGEYIGGVLPEGDGIDHRATYLHRTRNSPAAQAGHSENARWGTYLGNQAWRKDHGRSYDTSIDHLLKPSSENKRVWNVFGNEMIMDDNKIPVTQKVDTFLDNVPAEVIEANIAKNEADKAKVNSGEMTAAEYFGTNIR